MTTDATRSNAEQWHIPPRAPRLGEGMAHVEAVKQPVMAMSVIDLKPLISFFANELQRERDRVAVERTTASSAREALAACDERLKAMTDKAEEWKAQTSALVKRNSKLIEERDTARAQLEQAKTVPPGLVPGSVEAVLEAYRLLVGDSLEWSKQIGWFDNTKCDSDTMEEATHNIIQWLDVYAPGGVK